MRGKKAKMIRRSADWVAGKRLENGEDFPNRVYQKWNPPVFKDMSRPDEMMNIVKVRSGVPAVLGDCKRNVYQAMKKEVKGNSI